jgi:hypothetical protein
MALITDTVGDSLGLTESVQRIAITQRSATSQVRLDIASIIALLSVVHNVSAESTLSVPESSELYEPQYLLGRTVNDSIGVARAISAALVCAPTIAEIVRLSDAVRRGSQALAADSFDLADAQSAAYSLRVAEALRISPSALARALVNVAPADTVRLLDSLARFLAGDISDSFDVATSVPLAYRARALAQDSVAVADSAERMLVIRMTAADSVNLDEIDVPAMLYGAAFSDAVQVSAAYVAPDSAFVAWAVNAVTGSVAQYDNYGFNSFASSAGAYLGASETGLYELAGDSDDGDSIIARVKSGLAQLAESRFTILRDAYIGMRSEGSFVLRIATGDGDTYDYLFDSQNMRSTRVQLGKGMRARYVSFELISSGEDFDLDSVEFIPLSSTRRV